MKRNGNRKDRRGKRGGGMGIQKHFNVLSTAAEWHFIGMCQFNSDWPDTANPSRCSALTDECVTVFVREKVGRGSEASAAGGPRVNRASPGPLSVGFGEIWRTG